MAGPEERDPSSSPSTRFLVVVWWETRERRWARAVMRGHVAELPDGGPQTFSTPRELGALVYAAVRRRRRGRADGA